MARKPVSIPHTYSLPHLRIDRFAAALGYQPPKPKFRPTDEPGRERFSHGGKLAAELAHAMAAATRQRELRDPSVAAGKPNAYFEVASDAESLLPDKGFKGVRIGAVHRDLSGAQVGTLFVTTEGEKVLSDTIADYGAGSAKPASTKRIDQIERIAPGTIGSLWTDLRPLPEAGQRIWWECWCWPETAENLIRPAQRLNLRVSEQRLHFPDFEVIPVYATREDMERLLANTDAIEELRHASDSPHVYTHDLAEYQTDILEDLVARVTPAPDTAPAVCILDTGTARGHPLLAPSLAATDCHAVDESWLKNDHHGHGTEMAGIALLGDHTYPVGDQRRIDLMHRLESVKLLPPDGFPPNEPANLGFITQSAISLPEIEAPERPRVFCMAVTNDGLSGALPTSWSAAMDRAAAGLTLTDAASASPSAPPRLIVSSAGNVQDEHAAAGLAAPEAFPIEDPSQAWNLLTIGGFTDKSDIAHPNYRNWTPAAEVGDRSPYSRTSIGWSDAPVKPELVFEAGNRALSPLGTELVAGIESLSLLTTNRSFISDPLTTTWATSPATAEAARMAAILMAAEPDHWPETIRALMVHSAEWTPRMLERFRQHKGKTKALLLAREFGYGVPSLDRALKSARGDLALVSQATIQPFVMPTKPGKKGTPISDGPAKYKDLHLYRLPWPVARLEELGEKRVELKVTLSYFIEPSPGQIAPKTPALYRSHGVRFDLQHPLENEETFLARINTLAAAEEAEEEQGSALDDSVAETANEETTGSVARPSDDRWRFGSNSRSNKAAGSLHCDVWIGPGAELAARRTLAVYPVAGWWKNRLPRKRFNSKARYALVMTLRCIDEDVDLYSQIMTEIENRPLIDVEIG
jgi:subtilase family protein